MGGGSAIGSQRGTPMPNRHPNATERESHSAHVALAGEAIDEALDPHAQDEHHHGSDHAGHAAAGDDHAEHGAHSEHRDHGGHHGHHVEMFRRRFWWSLLLTVPLVLTSPMVMDWFGYDLDFPGIDWIGPVLGTALFVWGAQPFLAGGLHEARSRKPGMMLLIAMAITVAYAASMATSLHWFG